MRDWWERSGTRSISTEVALKTEQKIGWRKKKSSHDFLFRWAVGPRLLALTQRGQLSDIDSPASYMPDMLSHAKHRVSSIFASRRT